MAGIYIHIPFCSQACSYCDFHFSTSLKNKKQIISAIEKELINEQHYLDGALINTIYFGGGTPSLLESKLIESILQTIQNNFSLSENIECTLEANPEDISMSKIDDWFDLGVNRISLGVQSFRDEDLNYMNRTHTKQQSIQSIEMLKKSKIKNFSIDLIYGFPLLNNSGWVANLEKVIALNVPHISCYCLTVEKGTALDYFIKKKKEQPLQSETGREHFLIARNMLLNHDYNHYEISNFSKKGYKSLHNKNYWNKTRYLGVGPSAHSFNGISRRWNIRNNSIYCKKISRNEIVYEEEILTQKNIINEYILTSIRTSSGVSLNYIKDHMSKTELSRFNMEINKLEKMELIELKEETLYLNEQGMLLSDMISKNLFLI